MVRRRLVQNMRFVGDGPAPDTVLYREARALGIDQRDTVVRRRMVQRMRALLDASADAEPSAAELASYLERHAAELALPPRVRLTHVFLGAQRHGAALDAQARAVRERLRSAGLAPDEAAALGDPLPIPSHLPLASERELAARFGGDFAVARRWRCPPASGPNRCVGTYGVHLVWVHERVAGVPCGAREARALAVVEGVRQERAERAVRAALARWRRPCYHVDLMSPGSRDRLESVHVEGAAPSAPHPCRLDTG